MSAERAGPLPAGSPPPFTFQVDTPEGWTVVDAASDSGQRPGPALPDTSPGEQRLTERERRGVQAILDNAADATRGAGVALSLVKAGRDADERLFCASLSLIWYDSAPLQPDMSFLRLVAGEGDKRRELDTTLGTALVTTRETHHNHAESSGGLVVAGRTYDTQVFVPVPETTWTAVFSGTTPTAAHAGRVEQAVCELACSLSVDLSGRASSA